MKIFDAGTSNWVDQDGHQEAELHVSSGEAVRVWVLRVPAGASYGPLQADRTRHFFVCMRTAGARLHLGARVFRPLPGQTFWSEPGEVFGVGNDSREEVTFLVTRIGPDQDLKPLGRSWEDYLAEVRPQEPGLLSTTSNPAGR